MANTYLYGAFGHIGETIAQSAVQAGTVPVYVGTAPVNLVRGHGERGVVGRPVTVYNFVDAQKKLGYCGDWAGFTLCEAVTAHFNNPLGNIGPVHLINVLDPDVHRQSEVTKRSLTFQNGRAEFVSDTVILDTFQLEGKQENVDFILDYNYTRGSVCVLSANMSAPLSGAIDATWFDVDPDAVTEVDIIGGVSAGGEYSGLSAIALLYPGEYQVANLIAAPGWSQIPSVYNAMIAAGTGINGHWDSFVIADIPLQDENGAAVDTIGKAKAWKREHGYTSERSKVFWPGAVDNVGQVFHLSTLAVVELMRTDYTHSSVPMETCGNKAISVIRQYFGGESKNQGFDQEGAKELTSYGISTAISWGGRWVLWGDHTAAYAFDAQVDPRAVFDVSIRMLMHITNAFQQEWSTIIDSPMTRQTKDRIINREQEKLDEYVARGALVGSPRIVFLESENATTDMMRGDFRWDIAVTPTPPLKSATVYVAYTDTGFAAYFEEGEE